MAKPCLEQCLSNALYSHLYNHSYLQKHIHRHNFLKGTGKLFDAARSTTKTEAIQSR